jgi:hypothetical protein
VSFSQVDRVRVIDAAPGGEPFGGVGARERCEVGDLFAFDVDDAQRLAGFEFERSARLRLEAGFRHRT